MPRPSYPSDLIAAQANGAGRFSQLVLITRIDGTQLGFTSSDQDITYGGIAYKAADGLGSTQIKVTAGTGIDNLDLKGYISDGRILDTDILAGLYSGAGIKIWIFDRANPTSTGIGQLMDAYIGEITVTDGLAFHCEVRSIFTRLNQNQGCATSRQCRRQLGDTGCKKDLTAFTFSVTVTVTDQLNFVTSDTGSTSAVTDFFTDGVLTSTGGVNDGHSMDIKSGQPVTPGSNAGNNLQLYQEFPFPVSTGDSFTLVAGCDKTFPTCSTKFSNGANFHGEAHLPGNDTVMQYET